jgi:predicted DNA-binding transcriptional regulator AlpA
MNHDEDEELTIREVCRLMKFGRTTFYQRVREGVFTTHLSMNNRRVIWKSDLLAAREEAARRRGAIKQPPGKS